MTAADFVAMLERELQGRGVSFRRAELDAFVARVWPVADDDPDAAQWAQAFLDSGQMVPEGPLAIPLWGPKAPEGGSS